MNARTVHVAVGLAALAILAVRLKPRVIVKQMCSRCTNEAAVIRLGEPFCAEHDAALTSDRLKSGRTGVAGLDEGRLESDVIPFEHEPMYCNICGNDAGHYSFNCPVKRRTSWELIGRANRWTL